MRATQTKKRNSDQLLVIHRQCRSLSLPAVPVRRMQQLALNIFAGEHCSFFQKVSVVFCTDYDIRRLNAHYRKIDRVTDVLSFTIDDPDLLGEIFISLPRAQVQARRYRITCEEELLRLFVHGLFHLLGYDHETRRGRLRMELKESRYGMP